MFGTVRSKHIWLSDLRFANDPRELELGYENVISGLRSVLQSEHREPKRNLLSHLVDRLIAYFQGIQVFCSCFSQAVDELPMWAAYGRNYSGLAIGFRPAALLGIPARVQQVKYLDPSNENDEFKNLALGIATQVEICQQSNAVEPWISAVVDAITATTALKHQIWAYEKEVRLICAQRKEPPQGLAAKFPVSSLPNDKLIYWREPIERKARGNSVNYIEFPFGRFKDGNFDPTRSLKTTIIGPHCPLTVTSVESELREQGFYDCNVRKSNCQIRL
jgi:hypothetical protein